MQQNESAYVVPRERGFYDHPPIGMKKPPCRLGSAPEGHKPLIVSAGTPRTLFALIILEVEGSPVVPEGSIALWKDDEVVYIGPDRNASPSATEELAGAQPA